MLWLKPGRKAALTAYFSMLWYLTIWLPSADSKSLLGDIWLKLREASSCCSLLGFSFVSDETELLSELLASYWLLFLKNTEGL